MPDFDWRKLIQPLGGFVPQDYGRQFGRGMQWLTGQYQAPQPTQLTQRTAGIFERAGQPLEPGRVAPPTPGEQAEAMRAMTQMGQPPTAEPEAPAWIGAYGAPPFPTEDPPEGYEWEFSEGAMRWIPVKSREPAKMSAAERRQMELAEQKARQAQEQQQWERTYMERETGREAEEQARQEAWQQQQFQAQEQYQQQQMEQQMQMQEMEMQWRQEQMQMQQAEAERQERARLSASPLSWLQYASYTGETPAIQPWMMPLMQDQYPDLQTGQAIPGWTPEGGTAMPALATPSAQLYSRMGPTATAQFAGYRQARTGARPEEQAFRQRAVAPPGGGGRGLSWIR